MTRINTNKHLDRLDALTSLLKSDDFLTVAKIASLLGVSERTLHRDIAILRERGLPIEADKGRGGGIRLHQSWGVGRLTLSNQESIDLLVSLAIAEKMESPLFMANLQSIRHKLMASFSTAQKYKVKHLRDRIRIGSSASSFVLTSYEAADDESIKPLHRAFFLMQSLRINYRDAENVLTQRSIEPHYLYLNYPVWYILAWDHLRQDIRIFRCDRITHSVVNESTFELRSFDEFHHMVAGDHFLVP